LCPQIPEEIGSVRFQSAVLPALLCFGLWAQPGTADHFAVRSELSRIYAHLDSAFEQGHLDDVLRIALPDAMVKHGVEEVRFTTTIAQIKQALQNGAVIKQRTTIISLDIAGTTARVVTRSESSITMGGQTRSGVEQSEDTWVRTSDGWRLKLSVALGSSETAPSASSDRLDAVIAEINRYARSLDDLASISDAIGDARVVGLGEATHGTSEFSAGRARIVEYLAANKGFTVLAVEDNWAEALAVDSYIKTGQGTAGDALARLKGWPIRTRETLALVNAMRAINIQNPGRMTFAGFDMTWAETARDQVAEFINRAAPNQLAMVEKWYSEVIALGPRRPNPEANARPAAEAARKVVDLLDSARDVLVKASDDASWRHARQAAEIVYQATAFRIEGRSPGFRDEMMARNVQWLCEQEHPGEKIVIWAHNAHISSDSSSFFKPMGAWLREKLGNRYYGLAFTVAGGEVRAVGSKGLATHMMPPAAKHAGEGPLARAFLPSYFLDMRSLQDGAARGWLNQPHAFYTVGARWNEKVLDANTSVFSMAKSFDGLVFVRQGHASIAP
jgi:erythromycin esterase